jgi:microsomal dipeptidase-like Zn-dependent dipeptidase
MARPRAVIADLHAHYPMHLVPEAEGSAFDALASARGRARLRDRMRALLVGLAGRFANYRSFESGPRVTIESMRAGRVGVALSVLYSFFDEFDVEVPYGSVGRGSYLEALLRQIDLVERDIEENHSHEAAVVHDAAELDAAVEAGKVALVHCVEGGFHLGGTPEDVDRSVASLARRGVGYVVLAHLVWRGMATNAPALPFMPDSLYRAVFHQPAEGLSDLGRAAIRAMVRERVLIDLSHMSERALSETLELLDELDPGKRTPVIASHACFRFADQEYGLTAETLRRIAERDGVVGLILAQHQLNDAIRKRPTESFEDSIEVLGRHIDAIHDAVGSHRHTAIGSDLDGFIKPTLSGLETMGDMARLEDSLRARYGDDDGELIASGNALRVLRAGWG